MIPTTRITSDGICIQNRVWPNQFWFSLVSVMVCLLYLIFPLILTLVLYLSIFISLRRKALVGRLSENNDKMSSKLTTATWNVFKTLIFLTVLFFLCWVWNVSFFLLVTLGVPLSFTSPFYSFSVFMTNVNCCVNPFCYAIQYREFQIQARKLFCKQKCNDKEERSSCNDTVQSSI